MFRTPIEIDESNDKIDYTKSVVLIGSCFSENIGSIMKESHLDVTINPFGILFNPESIAVCLEKIIAGKPFIADDLEKHNERFHSWGHHGRFSKLDEVDTLEAINEELNIGYEAIRNTDFLILTVGTAWAYRLKESGIIVANCHKVPQVNFEKALLSHSIIEKRFEDVFKKLKEINPQLNIVLSVSPVRHWKDGAHQNNISKGHLHIAAQALCEKHSHVNYFPSYEIVLDELRDYRFFNEDMLHPSQLAIEYVWEKFSKTYLDDKSIATSKKVRQLNKVFSHRAEDTEKHQTLMNSTKAKIDELISGQ